MLPAFQIVRGVLPADDLLFIARQFDSLHRYFAHKRPGGQTGICLAECPEVEGFLKPIEKIASAKLRTRMILALDRSSCRQQLPDGSGALTLHQDTAALATDRPGPCCVMWMPLCRIDDETPTLDVSPVLPDRDLEHVGDGLGYSVLPDPEQDWPIVTMTRLNLGDAVLMGPRTLHRSHVRPWHTKTRLSLDLRFLAAPARSWRDRLFS